jgi:uridine kinase
MKKPYVISISGISGSGKTTVTNSLEKCLSNAVVVSFDDYDDIKLDRDINDWSADGNDENEWYVEPLAENIEKLLNEPYSYIIVDYPFGYRNLRVGKYINFAVFVDTPLDVALARRTIRDYTSRSENRNKIEVSLSAIEKELRFYLERSRPTYARMPETQKPFSDIVVDGTKSPEELANIIIEFIRNTI